MTGLLQFIVIINALFFLGYGLQCLISASMAHEFRRLGFPDSQRIMTGALQILGSAGSITGLIFPLIGAFAAGGLSVMMLVAFIARMKAGDSLLQSTPAFIFLLLNALIFWNFYIQI